MSGPGRVGPGNGEKSGQWTARKYSETGVAVTVTDTPEVSADAELAVVRAEIAGYRADMAALTAQIERATARGFAAVLRTQFPDATYVDLDLPVDDTCGPTVTAVYTGRGDDRRPLAVSDDDLDECHRVADEENVLLNPARPVDADYLDRHPASRHRVTGELVDPQYTFDVTAAAALPRTRADVDAARVQDAHRGIDQVVSNAVPDAASWTVGTEEWDNGYFYTASGMDVTRDDGSVECLDDPAVDGMLTELSDLDGPLGAMSTHTHHIGHPG